MDGNVKMTGIGYTNKVYTQKNYQNMTENRKRKKKVCAICGAEFESTAPYQKYCCLICREAARKAARRTFDEANPDYRKEYMREYRKRLKENKNKASKTR